MYSTRWSSILIWQRFPIQLEFANVEKQVICRNLVQIETAEFLKLHDRKAGIERVELTNLNIRPVDIVSGICKLYLAAGTHAPGLIWREVD